MSPRVRDEADETRFDDDGPEQDDVDETEVESDGGDDGEEGDDEDDGEPLTHLDDEAYETFVARELGGARDADGHPPVTAILVVLTLAIIVAVMLLA
jgi:hypothetical protein